MFGDLPDYIALRDYQITVFLTAMIFLAIGLSVGHMFGKDNRQPRDARGRFIKP